MNKKLNSFDALVYSTNKELNIDISNDDEIVTLLPEKQKLRVLTDKRNRGGKIVTIVSGFIGNDSDLEELCKILKTKCGVGGSAKDGEIIIQGDNKEKVSNILKTLNYRFY